MARKAKKPKKVKKPQIKVRGSLRVSREASVTVGDRPVQLPPSLRPFQIAFMSSEGTMDTRKRRFFTALQIAVGMLTADDMDKIEPILNRRIGAETIKATGKVQGYSF